MSLRSGAKEISSGEWMGEAEAEDAAFVQSFPDADGFQPPPPNPACGYTQATVSAIGAREKFSLLAKRQYISFDGIY
jgi:hypothetical protein